MTRSELLAELESRYGLHVADHHIDSALSLLGARPPAPLPPLGDVLEALLVSESWFFREPAALERALQELAPTAQRHPLRVLCAPCARGEEPLTVAMMLLESGLKPWQFHVTGVDLSELAIEAARSRLYGSYSFRGGGPADARQRYFQENQERWMSTVDDIQWEHANLLDWEPSGEFDLICCRNLLIYLSPRARRQLFLRLHRWLARGGRLVTAACEFALPPRDLFQAHVVDGVSLYLPLHAPATPPQPGSSLRPAAKRSGPPLPPVEPSAMSPHDLLDAAERLADRGMLQAAEHACRQALLSLREARAYHLLGVIAMARGDAAAAESALRQALALQPEHEEAGLQLSLLRERAGDFDEARRLRGER